MEVDDDSPGKAAIDQRIEGARQVVDYVKGMPERIRVAENYVQKLAEAQKELDAAHDAKRGLLPTKGQLDAAEKRAATLQKVRDASKAGVEQLEEKQKELGQQIIDARAKLEADESHLAQAASKVGEISARLAAEKSSLGTSVGAVPPTAESGEYILRAAAHQAWLDRESQWQQQLQAILASQSVADGDGGSTAGDAASVDDAEDDDADEEVPKEKRKAIVARTRKRLKTSVLAKIGKVGAPPSPFARNSPKA